MRVLLEPGELSRELAADVRAGLAASPKTLPPKYFYDARGSQLFDQITRLEEYYPTRTERAILTERADEIAGLSRAATMIELGSGSSEKTRLLITALRRLGSLSRFVPFDVDPSVLARAETALSADYPGLQVSPVVGDFGRQLPLLVDRDAEETSEGPRLVAFLGSTIGNLTPAERHRFLLDLRTGLDHADTLLLGVDLVKPADRLVRAYDDPGGVTAAFDKNVLAVLNRELDADFDPDAFDHRAVWDEGRAWIEMRLRSRRAQLIRVRGLGLTVPFAAGEELRTEISAKFVRPVVEAELDAAGFGLERWWTDAEQSFALALARPAV